MTLTKQRRKKALEGEPTPREREAMECRTGPPERTWVEVGEIMKISGDTARKLYYKGLDRAGVSREAIAKGTRGILPPQIPGESTSPATSQIFNEVRSERLVAILDHNAEKLALNIANRSDEELNKENVRNISIALGIHLEKRALLKGDPTEIVELTDRRKMGDLLELMLGEAERRGLIVKADTKVIDVAVKTEQRQAVVGYGET